MMEHTSGESEMRSGEGEVNARMHLHSGPSETSNKRPMDTVTDRLHGAKDRAAEYLDRTRQTVRSAVDDLSDFATDNANVFEPIRRHPMAAIGVAFSVGLVLAVATGGRRRHWMFERARLQLRTIVVSAFTAALVSEIHDMLDDGDSSDVADDVADEPEVLADDDELDEEDY